MFEKVLFGIERPGRYIGNEINAYKKKLEDASVCFALAFPDVYEVGLSHLGLRLLYHLLNRMDGVVADRVYAPWPDFERRLRQMEEPLRGIESERALEDFDFIGFSLQYELSYTNVLTILDLGRIPFRAKDRNETHPWIIAGGPCAYNPEPLAEAFDFIVLGEAEQVLPELVKAFAEWRAGRGARSEFLEELRKIPGIYIPSFFSPSYDGTGRLDRVEPLYADYTEVKKRLVLDLDRDAPIPLQPLVPLLDIVHNRLGLEIARGCTRGCRFCQAGFVYRPVRERDPGEVLMAAERALSNSGFEEVSLLSLSTGDYCHIQSLLGALMEKVAPEKVAVSFPSMRVGTLTPELMQLIRQVRKTGFTLAPEAGSERLRRVMNKEILDDDLLSGAESAFRLGWRLLKLYFMTGLPTETEADLDDLVNLCHKVWRLAKPYKASINVSVSTFVPKPHTPFQWVPQLPRGAVENRLKALSERLKRPGMRFKWHHPGHSLLEAVFARGDRRLFQIIVRAWELGARFDGWSESFREDLWQQAFEESGLDAVFYAYRQYDRDDVLPWDHLSSGVEKAFLWKEYERALAGEFTSDCRWYGCTGCGVCDHQAIRPVLQSDAQSPSYPSPGDQDDPVNADGFLYWFRYSKVENMRFFGQLEVAQSFARAVRRTGLPAAYSQGFHPHVKISFGGALPLGLESEVEEAYLTLVDKIDPGEVKSLMNAHLPEGLRVEEVVHVRKRRHRPGTRQVTYRVVGLIPWDHHIILQNWSKYLNDMLVRQTKRQEVKVKLRDIVADIRQLDENSLEIDLIEKEQICFRPMQILRHLLGESTERLAECRIRKVGASCLMGLEECEDVRRAYHQR